MRFYYGIEGFYKDVTEIVFSFCVKEDILTLPQGNPAQDALFGDPLPGVLKHIQFVNSLGEKIKIYPHEIFHLNLNTGELKIENRLRFYYGIEGSYKNITHLVFSNCVHETSIVIPHGNPAQDRLFGDPKPGILKHIQYIDPEGKEHKIHHHEMFILNVSTGEFKIENSREPKEYFLAIACVFRNSVFYLKEWIEHHRRMGVERFYLCDHLSVDYPHRILEPYIQEGLVELERCDREFDGLYYEEKGFEKYIHIPFYRSVVSRTKGKLHWLALLDSDEFLIPTREEDATVREVLWRHFDKAAVCVNWQVYGSSGIDLLPPNHLLMESFRKKAKTDRYPENFHVKCIVQPDLIEDVMNAHRVKCISGEVATTTDGVAISGPFLNHLSQKLCIEELRLNHYNIGDATYYRTYKIPFYRRYLPPCDALENYCKRHETLEFCEVEDVECMQRFIKPLRALVLPNACAIFETADSELRERLSLLVEELVLLDIYLLGREVQKSKEMEDWLESVHPHSSSGTNVVWWLKEEDYIEYVENKELFIQEKILDPRECILGKPYDILRIPEGIPRDP